MIRIEELTKRYGERTVVDRVSLVIERGSIAAIVGESGSGKSTLLRMINRLIEPSGGRVLLDGVDTREEPAHLLRRRIGYVIQGHGLFPHRTVAENIATVPRLLGWDEGRIRTRTEALLHTLRLDPAAVAAAYPHQLSGGQQQRVGVARALAAEPVVLLMDEPFGALDPVVRMHAQQELREVQRRFGTTIVLVTHDMDEAFGLGDRVAVMREGRMLQYDRPQALVAHPADDFVARMTGIADRALRLLSLTTVAEAMQPAHADPAGPGDPAGQGAGSLSVAATASLRDALSALLWRGVDAATVADAEGRTCGRIRLADILARGRP